MLEKNDPELQTAKDAERFFKQGEGLYRGHQYGQAIPLLEKAQSLRKSHVPTLLSLGVCYLREHRYPEAERQFLAALKFEPNNSVIHYNLACLYSLDDDLPRAIKALHAAILFDRRAKRAALTEPDLAKVRTRPEFELLLKE